jgi:hypothetical protein
MRLVELHPLDFIAIAGHPHACWLGRVADQHDSVENNAHALFFATESGPMAMKLHSEIFLIPMNVENFMNRCSD